MRKENKKLIKILVLTVFILVAGFEWLLFSISSWIRPELYQKQVLESIKRQTGQDVVVRGEIEFSLFPLPKIIINSLEVDGKSGLDTSIPTLTASKLEIHIAPMSLFTEHVEVSGVTLVNPVLSLERSSDNTVHWGWFNARLLKTFNNSDVNVKAPPLLIKGGAIKYQDNVNNENMLVENLDTSVAYGGNLFIKGKMKNSGRIFDFAIDGNKTDLPVTGDEFPLSLNISSADGSLFTISSVIDLSKELPKITGNFKFNISDAWNWFVSWENINNYQNKNGKNGQNNSRQLLPIELGGVWNLDNSDNSIKVQNFNMKGLNSQGEGNANIKWNNWYPTIAADMDFAYVDYFIWKRLLEDRIAAKKLLNQREDDFVTNYNFQKENPLPENIELRLNINAKKILFEKEEWLNTRLNAVLDRGAFTINQCDIKLAGGGLLSIFGVISQGGLGELRFEGNMEAKGKSLHDTLSMFYSYASDMPSAGMGEFSIKSNLYINSEQVRLFEAEALVGDMPIAGTITTYTVGDPRIDAQIKLNEVNFDAVRDAWWKKKLEEENDSSGNQDIFRKDQDISDGKKVGQNSFNTSQIEKKLAGFEWLKNLYMRIDAKVYVDKFTFLERQGEKASFYIYAYKGAFKVSDLQFIYPDGTMEISCSLNVNDRLPYIGLMISGDKLDTGYFLSSRTGKNNLPKPVSSDVAKDKNIKKRDLLLAPKKDVEPKEKFGFKQYADDQIFLDWMNDFNGTIDLSLHKFVHKNITMEKVKLQAKLEDKNLTVQNLGFVYSQAESKIVGTLYGGKIPGVSMNFTMTNADLYEVADQLIGIKNISGYANISGVLSASGWNFREWLDNMDAKFLFAAHGVKFQGINLASVGNVVEVARSSADVFNNVNNIVTKGTTEFSVDGAMNIKDGELRAPNLTLRSGLITGAIIGGIKLRSLIGQFSTLFRFYNLAPNSAPVMIINISGKLDRPEIKVDTSSLEDFVARRNVGRNSSQ